MKDYVIELDAYVSGRDCSPDAHYDFLSFRPSGPYFIRRVGVDEWNGPFERVTDACHWASTVNNDD